MACRQCEGTHGVGRTAAIDVVAEPAASDSIQSGIAKFVSLFSRDASLRMPVGSAADPMSGVLRGVPDVKSVLVSRSLVLSSGRHSELSYYSNGAFRPRPNFRAMIGEPGDCVSQAKFELLRKAGIDYSDAQFSAAVQRFKDRVNLKPGINYGNFQNTLDSLRGFQDELGIPSLDRFFFGCGGVAGPTARDMYCDSKAENCCDWIAPLQNITRQANANLAGAVMLDLHIVGASCEMYHIVTCDSVTCDPRTCIITARCHDKYGYFEFTIDNTMKDARNHNLPGRGKMPAVGSECAKDATGENAEITICGGANEVIRVRDLR